MTTLRLPVGDGAPAVLISFFALGVFWMTPRLKGSDGGKALPDTLQRLADAPAVQVGAIVAGHVLGVVAAHDRSVGVFSEENKKAGQYPLLATMVTYTVAGIALLVGA